MGWLNIWTIIFLKGDVFNEQSMLSVSIKGDTMAESIKLPEFPQSIFNG